MKSRSGTLGWYLERIASLPLLTPAQEQALARRLDALRRRHARALLAVPLASGHMAGLILACKRGRLRPADLFDPVPAEEAITTALKATKPLQLSRSLSSLNPRPELLDVIRRECSRALAKTGRAGWEGMAGMSAAELSRLLSIADARREAYARSRKEMAARNLRLVVSVAKRYKRHAPLDDLVQEGNRGLLRAVDRFDWRRGCRFTTYATHWVTQSIRRAATAAGEAGPALSADSAPERAAAAVEVPLDARLSAALASLSPAERRLVVLRFGLGGRGAIPLDEAAREAGLKPAVAAEAERKALAKMRQTIGEEED